MWSGPASFSSNERTIRLPATPGLFSVEITTASLCNATSSVDVVLTDPPTILSVTNDGLDCVDGTTDICFKIVTDPVDNGNFTYYWEGPNGFQSDLAEPCLLNVTDTVNGVYTLEVESNGCISNLVTSLVEVTNISERPSISGIDTYCEGSTLILSTTEFGGIGSEYFWITPNGQISTADSFLLLPDIDTMDGGAYAVYLVNEGCTTLVSDPLDIEVIPLPYLPEIFGETDYCEGDSIILYTSEQEDATFNWKGPQNFTASGQEIVVFPASSSNSGLYFIDAQRGECQTETQGSVLVEVTDIPPAPMILEFPDSICLDYQQTIELCVDPNSAVAGGSYLFLLVDPDTAISDTSRSLCQIIDISTDLFTEGRQSIFAKTIVNGCPSSSAIPTLVPMFEVPEEEANAGDDVILCDELDGQLNARDPIVGSGKWLFDVDDLFINRIHDSGSSFSLEDEQSAQAIWSLDYAACKDYDRDTTSALFIPYPEAFDDLVTTDIGRSVDFDFLFNDQYRDSVIISLINLGSKGDADLNDDQSLHYEPAPTSSGEEIINYEICDVNCPDLCSVAQIRILIGDGEDCTVPTIITPNDDGYNDYFIIPCLGNSLYDDNEVIIINQWGDEMFRQTSYKNDWQGTYNGDPVAEGTYFFLVKFGDKRPPQSGFIHIERD
jgi:gliding motility-associated-like protein